MTELDIVGGRIICAGTFSFVGEQINTYTPVVFTTATSPNLGSTGAAQGWWVKFGNLVMCWGLIRFLGTGVSAGSGLYRITLPKPAIVLTPLNYSGSGPELGWGAIRDDSALSTNSRQFVPRLTDAVHPTHKVAVFIMEVADGVRSVVTATDPFTWSSGDLISFFCIFPAELELIT